MKEITLSHLLSSLLKMTPDPNNAYYFFLDMDCNLKIKELDFLQDKLISCNLTKFSLWCSSDIVG